MRWEKQICFYQWKNILNSSGLVRFSQSAQGLTQNQSFRNNLRLAIVVIVWLPPLLWPQHYLSSPLPLVSIAPADQSLISYWMKFYIFEANLDIKQWPSPCVIKCRMGGITLTSHIKTNKSIPSSSVLQHFNFLLLFFFVSTKFPSARVWVWGYVQQRGWKSNKMPKSIKGF